MSAVVWFIMGGGAAMVLVVGYDLWRSRNPKVREVDPRLKYGVLHGGRPEMLAERYAVLVRLARMSDANAVAANSGDARLAWANEGCDYHARAERIRRSLLAQGIDPPWPPNEDETPDAAADVG